MEQPPSRARMGLALALAGSGLGIALGVVVAVAVFDVRTDADEIENLEVVSSAGSQHELLLRLMAPDDACWTRTVRDASRIDDEVEEGCGSVTYSVRFSDDIEISFERRPRASWTWCLVAAVDGKRVLTRGPDSNPDYSLDVYWTPPDPMQTSSEVEPVTCAEE